MTHSGRPDLLYVVHRTPYPPDKGDRIRTFHLLRHLSRRAAVHLACLADEPVAEETTAALGRYCERIAVVPLGGSRWLRAAWSLASGRTITEGAFQSAALASTRVGLGRQTRFTACLASASSVAGYLRLPELRDVPAVVDLDGRGQPEVVRLRRGLAISRRLAVPDRRAAACAGWSSRSPAGCGP